MLNFGNFCCNFKHNPRIFWAIATWGQLEPNPKRLLPRPLWGHLGLSVGDRLADGGIQFCE